MVKQGAWFEMEWPHLHPGAIYYFVGNREEQKKQNKFLIKNKKELSEKLLPEVRKEIDFFDSNTHKLYPYVQESKDGIIFHINDGGKYFNLGEEIGGAGKMVSGHNLDYFVEDAIAYNVASKLVEILNPDLDTPKILHDEHKTLYYPLPRGLQLLPEENKDCKLTSNWIKGIYEFIGLGDADHKLTNYYQLIDSEYGRIFVREGVLNATPKRGHKEFSWICSKLMNLAN